MDGDNEPPTTGSGQVCSNSTSLPAGWTADCDEETGEVCYVDPMGRKTQFLSPRDKDTKPGTMADCIGDELPYGWEVAFSPDIGVYYIDHLNHRNQVEDPREECRKLQIQMVENYLRQVELLDPMSTSSINLGASGTQVQRQSVERLNSSFQHLAVSVSPGQTSASSLSVAPRNYSQHQRPHYESAGNSSQCQQLSSPTPSRHSDQDRERLQQSLLDSKSRVELLKRELDTNARLLTLIDRFKTRDEEFAVEV